jgi:hypothetical protein
MVSDQIFHQISQVEDLPGRLTMALMVARKKHGEYS